MGRRKKTKIKINNQTIFNIIGFMFVAVGIISLASFLNHFLSPGGEGSGKILFQINQELVGRLGWMSFFAPFVIILVSGHFFNSKKLKFVKLNVSIGIILIFIAMLGLFRSGAWGGYIYDNLTLDFSFLGAMVILITAFVIGLVLFLDTSIDVFVLAIIGFFATVGTYLKDNVFRSPVEKAGGKKGIMINNPADKEQAFIKDTAKPKIAHNPVITQQQVAQAQKEFAVKPIVSNSSSSTWVYPPLTLLQDVSQKEADRGDVKMNADVIEKTLDSFGIRARVAEVNFGPTVTQYAIEITMGTKLSKITALANDLALALAAPTGQVRIEAPIPGRSLVGIEIPNKKPEIVTLKRLLNSNAYANKTDPLLVPLGLDVAGEAQAATIAKMPHVLIAGTTGSGKSVMLNAWITTLLMRTRPDELRMILVDPKQVEMTQYNGIPHLLTDVIVEPSKVVSALRWACAEMENRYKELAGVGVRNLEGYNALENVEKKPYIVFVIDELADLMMFAASEAEDLITRIAQKARAVGIHLVLATQRPSVDVITGLMKANIPTRLAFNVSSMIDSRVIIDSPGAEKLLGKGDMFYLPPDQAKPRRIQGPFITEKEVNEVVKFLRSQVPVVHYTEEITQQTTNAGGNGMMGGTGGDEDRDPLFDQAVNIISQFDKASASLLQRRLKVGYARAARMLDELEAAGFVGPSEGSKPREVIKRPGAAIESEEEEIS
jgi:DNA segregation ATPase FtsK/SpoIIIE, S-DNA-T family